MTQSKRTLILSILAGSAILLSGSHAPVVRAASSATSTQMAHHKIHSTALVTYNNIVVDEVNSKKTAVRATVDGKFLYIYFGSDFVKDHALPTLGEPLSITGYQKMGGFSEGPLMFHPTKVMFDGKTYTDFNHRHMHSTPSATKSSPQS